MEGDALPRSTSQPLSRTALETWRQKTAARLKAAVGLLLRLTARTRRPNAQVQGASGSIRSVTLDSFDGRPSPNVRHQRRRVSFASFSCSAVSGFISMFGARR